MPMGPVIILLYLVYFISAEYDNATKQDILENQNLDALQVIRKYGYPLERHWVTTEDGFILEMQRIPYGLLKMNITNRPAILFAHGSSGSSIEMLSFGHKSMAFVFAEGGYDVWLGNARGTMWSRRHKWLSPQSKEFWDYSFHEVSVYDYPAQIDYIRNNTGQDKIFFLGHSQGATGFFVMTSVREEVNDKLRMGVVLAPTVYTNHNHNHVLKALAHNDDMAKRFLGTYGTYEIPRIPPLLELTKALCRRPNNPLFFLCTGIVSTLMGYDIDEFDQDVIPTVAANAPAGISYKVFSHYTQLYTTRKFQQYDFGREGNLEKYGTPEPPQYNISKITCPVGVFYCRNDPFSDIRDTQDLIKQIPSLAMDYLVPYERFNHIDFLFGIHVVEWVYKPILELLAKY